MTARQKQYKVLVIGDICLDQYFMCRNTRLNPESSAPLVQITSTYVKEGMSGNVAYCLNNLGIETNKLHAEQYSKKTRYVNAVTKEQLLRVDFDPKIDKCTMGQLSEKILYNTYDAIVISDYDKGFLGYDEINYVTYLYDGPIFLDTKKKDLEKFNSRIILKINEHEANAATKVPKHAIVTMGAQGATWYNERWRAYRSESVDVCGAGDAFLAGLVYGYLRDIDNMIEYAMVNAGLSVRHIGTYSPTLKELTEGMHDYHKQYRKN